MAFRVIIEAPISVPAEVDAAMRERLAGICEALDGFAPGSGLWRAVVSAPGVVDIMGWRFVYGVDRALGAVVVKKALLNRNDTLP